MSDRRARTFRRSNSACDDVARREWKQFGSERAIVVRQWLRAAIRRCCLPRLISRAHDRSVSLSACSQREFNDPDNPLGRRGPKHRQKFYEAIERDNGVAPFGVEDLRDRGIGA
jgi:hypothetical protein